MPETVIRLGEVGRHLPSHPWILVFGGVTREGNRRARRAVRAAIGSNRSVLWYDGYSERFEAAEAERVPLDVSIPDGKVVIVEYAVEERGRWLNRMVEGVPAALIRPLAVAEDRLAEPQARRVPILTPVRRLLQSALEFFRKKVLRRTSQIFRGIVGWRIVRKDVFYLRAEASPPTDIIYGDEFALTLGWRAARLWPDARTSMEFVER